MKVASRFAKLLKKLRSQLNKKETDFDDTDQISILAFLKNICDTCDSFGTHEGAAMGLISYIMKKPASPSLEARLSPKKVCATGLHDGRPSS